MCGVNFHVRQHYGLACTDADAGYIDVDLITIEIWHSKPLGNLDGYCTYGYTSARFFKQGYIISQYMKIKPVRIYTTIESTHQNS